MTAYQLGFATGRRVRLARCPYFETRADRWRWKSGFYDGATARQLAERAACHPLRFSPL